MLELVDPHVTMFSKQLAPSGKNRGGGGGGGRTNNYPSSKLADGTFAFDSVHSW